MGINHPLMMKFRYSRDLTRGMGQSNHCRWNISALQPPGPSWMGMPTCLQCHGEAVNTVPGHKPKAKLQCWEPGIPRSINIPVPYRSCWWRWQCQDLCQGISARCPHPHLSCSRSCVSFRRAFRCRMHTSFCCSGVRYCSGVGGFIPWLSLQRLYLAERLWGHMGHSLLVPAWAHAGVPREMPALGLLGASQRSPAGRRGRVGVSYHTGAAHGCRTAGFM